MHGDEESVTSASPPSPIELLQAAGAEFRVHLHPAALTQADLERETRFALQRSVKTLVLVLPSGAVVLAAIPGLARVGFGALARAVGVPRAHLKPAGPAILEALGMEPGGASPICGADNVTTVFDVAVPAMGRVYTGSGRADCTIEIAAEELVRLAGRRVVAAIASGSGAR